MKIGSAHQWHIWLGWIVGVPLLIWTATGLLMVSRPIEEVRGEHLRSHAHPAALPYEQFTMFADSGAPIESARLIDVGGAHRSLVSYPDGSVSRFDAATGQRLLAVSRQEAISLAQKAYSGSGTLTTTTLFADPAAAPGDFRKDRPAWQVALDDGTNIYIDADTGETLALRTRFWRVFDFAWGLHIMDPQTREDTHHPLLVGSAAFGLLSVLIRWWLLIRRRRRRAAHATAA